MPLSIRNEKTVALAREVAQLKGKGLTETIHEALENERRIEVERRPSYGEMMAFLNDLHKRLGPPTGLKADKAFFDSLYDE